MCAILTHGLSNKDGILPLIAGCDSKGPDDDKSLVLLDDLLLQEMNRILVDKRKCRGLKVWLILDCCRLDDDNEVWHQERD